jgi:hypothetical protein
VIGATVLGKMVVAEPTPQESLFNVEFTSISSQKKIYENYPLFTVEFTDPEV